MIKVVALFSDCNEKNAKSTRALYEQVLFLHEASTEQIECFSSVQTFRFDLPTATHDQQVICTVGTPEVKVKEMYLIIRFLKIRAKETTLQRKLSFSLFSGCDGIKAISGKYPRQVESSKTMGEDLSKLREME